MLISNKCLIALIIATLVYFVYDHVSSNYLDFQSHFAAIKSWKIVNPYDLETDVNVEENGAVVQHRKTSPKNVTSNESIENMEWLKKKEKTYSEMNKIIKKVCKEYQDKRTTDTSYDYKLQQLMVDTYYKWSFCHNDKVGSTTWTNYLRHFLLQKERPNNPTEDKSYYKSLGGTTRQKLWHFFRIPTEFILQTNETIVIRWESLGNFLIKKSIFTFAFVRHPFERLVSAFKSKAKKMYIKSFPMFIEYVLGEKTDRRSERYRRKSMHWLPYEDRCHFCTIPYKAIGRMETFDEDVRYISLRNKWENIIPLPSKKSIHKNASKRNETEDKANEYLSYFMQLNKTTVEKLYKKYKMDFDLFSYDASAYLQLFT